MTVFIYVPKDPLTGQVRYVGATRGAVARRFQLHIRESKTRLGIKHLWLRGLLAQGLFPILEIIDEVAIEESPMWEAAYIDFFKGSGCELLNKNRGIHSPMFHSEETKKKISAAHIGNTYNLGKKRTMSPEWKANNAEAAKARRGTKWTDEQRERLRISRSKSRNHNFGKTFSPEIRSRMSAGKKGKPWTSVQRESYNQRRQNACH